MRVDSRLYVEYLEKAHKLIRENETYVTDLDLATGDGDHWSNLNKGFAALMEMKSELRELPLNQLFLKIGMTLMATIGGSSGVLYGGAYMAAARTLANKEAMDAADLCQVLNVMLEDIMNRGKAQRGFKTMIDALAPAVDAFREGLEKGLDEKVLLAGVKEASIQGANATKEMQAVRGRATYQADKGVGHLDPGAVTMSYQLAALCDTVSANLGEEYDE